MVAARLQPAASMMPATAAAAAAERGAAEAECLEA